MTETRDNVAKVPFVSVIIPCRNERDYIERCLETVFAQTWPADRLEVIVVDGMSDDGTREILARLVNRYPNLEMVDNNELTAPTAMNIGLGAARGDFIVRVDAHAAIPPEYIEIGVGYLEKHPDVWCVGGPRNRVGETPESELVGTLSSSVFTTGNTYKRVGGYEGPTDQVAYPIWRRVVFDKIGRFDEDMVRNQDDDIDVRVLSAGGIIYQLQRLRATYYVRSTVRKTLRQFFQYAYWKLFVLKKNGRLPDWKAAVPTAFFLSLIVLGVIGGFWMPAAYAALGILAGYVLAAVAFAFLTAFKSRLWFLPIVPFLFAALHAVYAWGFLRGFIDAYIFGLTAADAAAKVSATRITR
ncbi:MAG: glycosyltransferase [Candidatus Coatesbacteria bacterium]|nr:MAG: glycosyltransferase [Candidatus Coatesbacteria bacterium]